MTDIYSPIHPAAFFMIEMRLRKIREILEKRYGDTGVKNIKLLEIGCGTGQWLTEFVMLGFSPSNLAGVDIDKSRTEIARSRIPTADIRICDASELPWENGLFDIVFQSTVFTSIPDKEKKQLIATEMMRVCRPNGLILWYDFTFNNPNNPHTKAVPKNEIKSLFSPWNIKCTRITLAPPIARRLIFYSVIACELLEKFCPFLNTHIIAEIAAPGTLHN